MEQVKKKGGGGCPTPAQRYVTLKQRYKREGFPVNLPACCDSKVLFFFFKWKHIKNVFPPTLNEYDSR